MEDTSMGDGWTAVPNDLLDNMHQLGNAELRVLLAIYRKTAGYQKERDRLSVSQLADLTGLTSRNAQTAITLLLEKGFIGREPATKQGFTYFAKPYPVGTRSETTENHIPSDTVSLGDMVPYPLGTRLEDKPYPLGTTQKKDLKKKEKTAPAAADAAPSPPARTKKPRKAKTDEPAPEEPVTPAVIRSALAEACDITSASTREVAIAGKQAAKILWQAERERRSDDEIAAIITWGRDWLATNAWQCRDGSSPRPDIYRNSWGRLTAAYDATHKPVPAAVASEPYDYDNEPSPYAAREAQRAARRNGSHP